MLDDLFQQIDKAKIHAKSHQFAEDELVRKNKERLAIKIASQTKKDNDRVTSKPFFTMVGRIGKEFSPPGFLSPVTK